MIGNLGENFSENEHFQCILKKIEAGSPKVSFKESRKVQSGSLFPFTNQISFFQHRRNAIKFFMLKLDKYSLRWNY